MLILFKKRSKSFISICRSVCKTRLLSKCSYHFFFFQHGYTLRLVIACLKNQPCDVMREMRGEGGKKTPKKEMDNPSILWRHKADFLDTLSHSLVMCLNLNPNCIILITRGVQKVGVDTTPSFSNPLHPSIPP